MLEHYARQVLSLLLKFKLSRCVSSLYNLIRSISLLKFKLSRCVSSLYNLIRSISLLKFKLSRCVSSLYNLIRSISLLKFKLSRCVSSLYNLIRSTSLYNLIRSISLYNLIRSISLYNLIRSISLYNLIRSISPTHSGINASVMSCVLLRPSSEHQLLILSLLFCHRATYPQNITAWGSSPGYYRMGSSPKYYRIAFIPQILLQGLHPSRDYYSMGFIPPANITTCGASPKILPHGIHSPNIIA